MELFRCSGRLFRILIKSLSEMNGIRKVKRL